MAGFEVTIEAMDDKRKALFDACMRQAEFFYKSWDSRRNYEWKTTTALWTLGIGGIAFVKKPWLVPHWIGIAVVLGYGFLWLKMIWQANEFDRERMRFYRQQADSVMRDASHIIPLLPEPTKWKYYNLAFLQSWSMQFQFISVATLIVLFYTVPR